MCWMSAIFVLDVRGKRLPYVLDVRGVFYVLDVSVLDVRHSRRSPFNLWAVGYRNEREN